MTERFDPVDLVRELAKAHQEAQDKPAPPYSDFDCLGLDGERYYYQPHSTGQVLCLKRASHTSTNLCALAGIEYWRTVYGHPKTGAIDWVGAASDLFARQAQVGIFDPDRIRGRGAWIDRGRVIIHLGDKLLVDGKPLPVRLPTTDHYYQTARRLIGPGAAEPLDDEHALRLLMLAAAFRWSTPASGHLLAGWIVLAPICGLLRWRPHIWLTAAAGSGKSTLLEGFVAPLLSDVGVVAAGGTSAAGLRQYLGCDALPVVADETDGHEQGEQRLVEALLALARISSSESRGSTYKGTADHAGISYRMRSMFLLSSIATRLDTEADQRRFTRLALCAPDGDQREHWAQLSADLDQYVSDEVGQALIARTIKLAPMIQQAVRVFVAASLDLFRSQARADQIGTLMAGAWSLIRTDPPTPEEASQLMASLDWEPYQDAQQAPDHQRCLALLLQAQIAVDDADRTHRRTVVELAQIAAGTDLIPANVEPISKSAAVKALGRHGFRVAPDDGALQFAAGSRHIASLVRDTNWKASWVSILMRNQGATVISAPVRFSGIGTHRGVAIPASCYR